MVTVRCAVQCGAQGCREGFVCGMVHSAVGFGGWRETIEPMTGV